MSKTRLDQNNRLILLVDDNPEHLRLLSKILESKGFKVKKAVNGKTAIEIAKKQHHDLILLNINMPNMNGYEVYRQLKSHKETVNIPVIFMGTLEQVTDKIRRFEVSKIDCITKPFQELEVLSRVQNKLMFEQQNRELIAYNQQLEKAKYEHSRFTKALVTSQQNLKSVVFLDPLTKLANRIKFDEYLNWQWQKLSREKLPISLLLCDVNFSKNSNHADAHLTIDNCLQQIATEIKSVVKRSTDLVARYENKKFAVILANTDAKGAVYVGKLIQEKVDYFKLNYIQFGENESFTLNIGVATIFPNVKMLPITLIDMVEKAIDTVKV